LLRVENFKSARRMDLRLASLTPLIGPFGGGKSKTWRYQWAISPDFYVMSTMGKAPRTNHAYPGQVLCPAYLHTVVTVVFDPRVKEAFVCRFLRGMCNDVNWGKVRSGETCSGLAEMFI